jgi:hypothetical protein
MIRFECGAEDRVSATYGPFEYAQLVYGQLTVDDGHELACLDEQGDWRLSQSFDDRKPAALAGVQLRDEDVRDWWSDAIIYAPGMKAS